MGRVTDTQLGQKNARGVGDKAGFCRFPGCLLGEAPPVDNHLCDVL